MMQNQKQEVNKWLTSADVVPEAVLFFAEVAEATKHLKTVILAITAKVSEQLNVLLATEKVILKTKNKEVKRMASNICANCRYFNLDGYCQLLGKKVNSQGHCRDFEED